MNRGPVVAMVMAAAVLLAAPARAQDAQAKALDAASLVREVEAAVMLTGGLDVTPSKTALREGESLVLTIDIPRAGYLNVISINPAGEPTVLFPNAVLTDNRVEPGPFTFPTPAMGFDVRASPPHGESRVAAFFSSEPLDLNMSGERSAGSRFARLSMIGRDLVNLFGTRGLQGTKDRSLRAGLARVLVCAPAGPCDAAPTAVGEVARIVGALLPGILRDKATDLPEPKGPLRAVSQQGVLLTKASEGFVPRLYHDAAGYCTIAYGHLLRLANCTRDDRERFPRGVAEPQGERLLLGDLKLAQRAVSAYVTADLSEGQYASLVDFTYNVGAGNLRRSTLLKAVNAGQHDRVPAQFKRWVRAGGRELRGLKVRREREIELYFQGRVVPKAIPRGEDVEPIDIIEGEPSR